MITQISELKKSIKQRQPQIIVSKELISNNRLANESSWVEIGFMGLADFISTTVLFVMSHFSKEYDYLYTKKKLNYRYSKAKESGESIEYIAK